MINGSEGCKNIKEAETSDLLMTVIIRGDIRSMDASPDVAVNISYIVAQNIESAYHNRSFLLNAGSFSARSMSSG